LARFEDDWATGELVRQFINGRRKTENVKAKAGVKRKRASNATTTANKRGRRERSKDIGTETVSEHGSDGDAEGDMHADDGSDEGDVDNKSGDAGWGDDWTGYYNHNAETGKEDISDKYMFGGHGSKENDG
jgi:hypothetical protein